jgi:ParB family chromosome partitioning protein
MTLFWTPTVRTYFGRVPKARILEAVREAVSDEAAEQIEGLKKQPMAEAAEQLVVGTGWLPVLLRTLAVGQSKSPHETRDDGAFSVAAE